MKIVSYSLIFFFVFKLILSETRIEKTLTTIPYYSGGKQTKSYTGYLLVKPEIDGHLWFWFFESRNSPDDPLAVWLNGGK